MGRPATPLEWKVHQPLHDSVWSRQFVFDFLTFGILLYLFRAPEQEFRTGWFIESLLTELVIALVVRTRRICYRSRPGKLLLASTFVVIGFTLALPYVPFRSLFDFVPMPAPLMLMLIGLTVIYVIVAELAKKVFYAGIMKREDQDVERAVALGKRSPC